MNRLFALLVIGWAVFCLLIYPIQLATQGKEHYDKDRKTCYADFGLNKEADLKKCLDRAAAEFSTGLFAGAAADPGHGASLGSYYRELNWWLLLAVALPPAVVYFVAWAFLKIFFWVWRGFKLRAE